MAWPAAVAMNPSWSGSHPTNGTPSGGQGRGLDHTRRRCPSRSASQTLVGRRRARRGPSPGRYGDRGRRVPSSRRVGARHGARRRAQPHPVSYARALAMGRSWASTPTTGTTRKPSGDFKFGIQFSSWTPTDPATHCGAGGLCLESGHRQARPVTAFAAPTVRVQRWARRHGRSTTRRSASRGTRAISSAIAARRIAWQQRRMHGMAQARLCFIHWWDALGARRESRRAMVRRAVRRARTYGLCVPGFGCVSCGGEDEA
jgi:hypothetical protein